MKRKHPDRLVDSCKRWSVNWMAEADHGPFSNLSNNIFNQAVGLGVLQTLAIAL